jgi:hypothetical protein
MITQYEIIKEFDLIMDSGAPLTINKNIILTINMITCNFESIKNTSFGSWSKEMEKELDEVLCFSQEFINENDKHFQAMKPCIFSIGEVRHLINDIKNDPDGIYDITKSKPNAILKKFIKRTIELDTNAEFNK